MGGGQTNLFGLKESDRKSIISVRKQNLLTKSSARLTNWTLANSFNTWRDNYRIIILLRCYASQRLNECVLYLHVCLCCECMYSCVFSFRLCSIPPSLHSLMKTIRFSFVLPQTGRSEHESCVLARAWRSRNGNAWYRRNRNRKRLPLDMFCVALEHCRKAWKHMMSTCIACPIDCRIVRQNASAMT